MYTIKLTKKKGNRVLKLRWKMKLKNLLRVYLSSLRV